jgi:enoyl-CoA hydratase/carnithine racemase
MWQMVPDMVEDLEEDEEIRVIILRAAGDQAFVAGADISQFQDRRRNMDDELEYRRVSGRGSQSLTNIRKPLLAMIHGYCVGGVSAPPLPVICALPQMARASASRPLGLVWDITTMASKSSCI